MRRAAEISGLVLAALLAGGLGLAWANRAELARVAIDVGLARAGFAEAHYRVERFDFGGLKLAEIDLGPALAAGAISVEYDLSAPWAPRIDDILIESPRVDLSDPSLPGFGPTAGDGAGEGGGGFDPGPLAVRIVDGEVRWVSPLGPLRAAVSGELTRGADGALQSEVAIVAEAERGRVTAELSLAGTIRGDVAGELRLAGGWLEFERGRIDGLSGEVGFTIVAGALATLHAALSELRLQVDGVAVASGALSVSRQGEVVLASFEGRARGAEARIEISGTPNLAAGSFRLQRLSLEAAAPYHAALWRHLDPWAPTAGRASLHLVGRDLTLDLGHLAAAPALSAAAVIAEGFLTVVVDLDDVALPGIASGISGIVTLDLSGPAGEIEASLAAPALLTAGEIALGAAQALGVPATLARGPVRLTIAPSPAIRLRPTRDGNGSITGVDLAGAAHVSLALERLGLEAEVRGEGRIDGTGFTGRVAAAPTTLSARDVEVSGHRARHLGFTGTVTWQDGETTAAGLLEGTVRPRLEALSGLGWITARLPLKLRASGTHMTLALDGRGELRLPALRLSETLSAPAPLKLALLASEAPLLRLEWAELSHEVRARIVPEPFTLALAREAGPLELELAAEEIDIALQRGESAIRLLGGGLAAPALGVTMEGVEAELRNLAGVEFKIGAIRWTEAPLALPRLRAIGRARIGPEDIGLGLSVLDQSHFLRLDVTARHGFADGVLEARITLPPTVFEAEGTQPGALFPALAGLERVAGRVAGAADLRLADGTVSGSATIELADIGFEIEAATVAGLNARIALSELWPPRTAAPQRLTIASIVAGVEAREIEARVSLVGTAERPLVFRIEGLEATTPFARVKLEDTDIDADAGTHDLKLRLSEVDLAKLFERLEIEGVTGTGRLSGTIPIAVLEQGFAVSGGWLEAEGPGVIRISLAALDSALTGSGEPVKLLLSALEDFRYSRLVLGLEKPPDGRGKLTLSIEGHNPAVLDGHPFAVNIDLRGQFDRLLETALEVYRLSDQAIRGTVR